jgi:2-haloacid dehalogenase/putative hydrolase of the HAD superfamily
VVAAVLLDFYGTLVGGDEPVIAQACEKVEATAAAPVSPGDVARSWSEGFTRACEGSGARFTGQRAAAHASLVRTLELVRSSADPDDVVGDLVAYWRRPPLLDDARDFLRRIDRPVCIVSNIDRRDLEAALDHHGLVFEHVVTSDDVRSYKPQPEIFRHAMATLGVDGDDLLHVGDSLGSDVAGANGVGIPVAWVNRRARPRPARTHLWAEVAHLGELAELLDLPSTRPSNPSPPAPSR